MKYSINQLLKTVLKFNLQSDYPDELIDNHIEMMKSNFQISKTKIKSILKINKNK